MPHPVAAKTHTAAFSEIHAISERLEKILHAVADARERRRLSVDGAFIFLAVGHLGISKSGSGITIRPVSCIDLASKLKIPKETVRRKATNLAALGLVSMTARGVIVEDLDEWRLLAEAMLQ